MNYTRMEHAHTPTRELTLVLQTFFQMFLLRNMVYIS